MLCPPSSWRKSARRELQLLERQLGWNRKELIHHFSSKLESSIHHICQAG